MGINEDPPNGESKGDVWRTCYSKSAGPRSPPTPGPRRLCLGIDSKAGRGVGALYGGDRGSTWRAPTVGRGLGQLWTGPLEGGHPVVRGAYPSLSGWS